MHVRDKLHDIWNHWIHSLIGWTEILISFLLIFPFQIIVVRICLHLSIFLIILILFSLFAHFFYFSRLKYVSIYSLFISFTLFLYSLYNCSFLFYRSPFLFISFFFYILHSIQQTPSFIWNTVSDKALKERITVRSHHFGGWTLVGQLSITEDSDRENGQRWQQAINITVP